MMSLGSEKNPFIIRSRLFSYIVVFSMLLLLSSYLSLIELHNDTPIAPKPGVRFISSNDSSSFISSTPIMDVIRPRATLVMTQTPNRTFEEELYSQRSDLSDGAKCDKKRALAKVYMYDLPPKFHFGMLGWTGAVNQTWPNLNDDPSKIPRYPGGLNLQHSPEYWLTLDLLASEMDNVVRPCSAIRVRDFNEADILFVPFFSSLSYNRNSKHRGRQKASVDRVLQEELVEYLMGRLEWRQLGGTDHLVIAHHPNSLLFARKMLASSMLLLSDFGRYPREIANLQKDVIAPYKHMVRTIPEDDSPSFDKRPTLVYFQGAIYRKDGGVIRQVLHSLLQNEKDVHFKYGNIHTNGIRGVSKGMASSKFCLHIAGDTPSSVRLFDAITSHCVPVIISDEIELPYEDILDYSEFCIFVLSSDAMKKGYLMNLLRSVTREKWTKMWERLKKISLHFEYQYPSLPNDAVDMIWQTIARKKSPSSLSIHRKNRYRRPSLV